MTSAYSRLSSRAPPAEARSTRDSERLEKDLGGRLGRAAVAEHLAGDVQVGLAHGESFGERKRITGLDQNVEAPALHLRSLVDERLEYLRRLAHGHTRFVLLPTNPAGHCWANFLLRLADCRGRGVAAHEFLHARLEHAALRLDVRAKLVDATTHLHLELTQPLVVRRNELVVAAVELARHVGHSMLEPLRARVADVGEPFREHGFGLPRERFHRPIQLPREALRGVLARGLHELGEPLRGLVRVGRDRAVHRALELLDLAPRDVFETGLDALDRIDLLALSLLRQVALPARETIFELVQCPAALGGVYVELVARDGESVFHGAAELRPEPRNGRALLFTLCGEPLGVRGEPQLDLAQKLLLPLLELADPRLRRLGCAVEILRPLGEPVLHLSLNLAELVAECRGCVVLALGDELPALLGDLPLLLLQHRARVRAG